MLSPANTLFADMRPTAHPKAATDTCVPVSVCAMSSPASHVAPGAFCSSSPAADVTRVTPPAYRLAARSLRNLTASLVPFFPSVHHQVTTSADPRVFASNTLSELRTFTKTAYEADMVLSSAYIAASKRNFVSTGSSEPLVHPFLAMYLAETAVREAASSKTAQKAATFKTASDRFVSRALAAQGTPAEPRSCDLDLGYSSLTDDSDSDSLESDGATRTVASLIRACRPLPKRPTARTTQTVLAKHTFKCASVKKPLPITVHANMFSVFESADLPDDLDIPAFVRRRVRSRKPRTTPTVTDDESWYVPHQNVHLPSPKEWLAATRPKRVWTPEHLFERLYMRHLSRAEFRTLCSHTCYSVRHRYWAPAMMFPTHNDRPLDDPTVLSAPLAVCSMARSILRDKPLDALATSALQVTCFISSLALAVWSYAHHHGKTAIALATVSCVCSAVILLKEFQLVPDFGIKELVETFLDAHSEPSAPPAIEMDEIDAECVQRIYDFEPSAPPLSSAPPQMTFADLDEMIPIPSYTAKSSSSDPRSRRRLSKLLNDAPSESSSSSSVPHHPFLADYIAESNDRFSNERPLADDDPAPPSDSDKFKFAGGAFVGIAGLASLLFGIFGADVPKICKTLEATVTSSVKLKDAVALVAEEVFGMDISGKKTIVTALLAANKEGRKFAEMSSRNFKQNLSHIKSWKENSEKLVRAVKLKRVTTDDLTATIAEVSARISTVKRAINETSERPIPPQWLLSGAPGTGKTKLLIECCKQLDIAFEGKSDGNSSYIIPHGAKHFPIYSGEPWIIIDELGASAEPGAMGGNELNQLVSELGFPAPAADIEHKEQKLYPSAVLMGSNFHFSDLLWVGTRQETIDAMRTRLKEFQVHFPDYDSSRSRTGQAFKSDWSHLSILWNRAPANSVPTWVSSEARQPHPESQHHVNVLLTVPQMLRIMADDVTASQANFKARHEADSVALIEPSAGCLWRPELSAADVPRGERALSDPNPTGDLDTRKNFHWIAGRPGTNKTSVLIPYLKTMLSRMGFKVILPITMVEALNVSRVSHHTRTALILDDLMNLDGAPPHDDESMFNNMYNNIPSDWLVIVVSNYGTSFTNVSHWMGRISDYFGLEGASYSGATAMPKFQYPSTLRRTGLFTSRHVIWDGMLRMMNDERITTEQYVWKLALCCRMAPPVLIHENCNPPAGTMWDIDIQIECFNVLGVICALPTAVKSVRLLPHVPAISTIITNACEFGETVLMRRVMGYLSEQKLCVNARLEITSERNPLCCAIVRSRELYRWTAEPLYVRDICIESGTFDWIALDGTLYHGTVTDVHNTRLTEQTPHDWSPVMPLLILARTNNTVSWRALSEAWPEGYKEKISNAIKVAKKATYRCMDELMGRIGLCVVVVLFVCLVRYLVQMCGMVVNVVAKCVCQLFEHFERCDTERALSKNHGRTGPIHAAKHFNMIKTNSKYSCSDEYDVENGGEIRNIMGQIRRNVDAARDWDGKSPIFTKVKTKRGYEHYLFDPEDGAGWTRTHDDNSEDFLRSMWHEAEEALADVAQVKKTFNAVYDQTGAFIAPNNGKYLHGIAVNDRLVVTSRHFVRKNLQRVFQIGNHRYTCQLLYEDPSREYVAFVTDRPMIGMRDISSRFAEQAMIRGACTSTVMFIGEPCTHTQMCPFTYQETPQPTFTKDDLKSWTSECGVVGFGYNCNITGRKAIDGDCGSPMMVNDSEGNSYIAGFLSAASTFDDVFCYTLMPHELIDDLYKKVKDFKWKSELHGFDRPMNDPDPTPTSSLVFTNKEDDKYVRRFFSFASKRIVQEPGNSEVVYVPPSDSAVTVVGYVPDNKVPMDPKGKAVRWTDFDSFTAGKKQKVPALLVKETMEQFPEKVPVDSAGNKHVFLMRTKPLEANFYVPRLHHKMKALAGSLGAYDWAELTTPFNVLTPEEAVFGSKGANHSNKMQLNSSLDVMLAHYLRAHEKRDVADDITSTIDPRLKNIINYQFEKLGNDELVFIPATVMYKKEQLKPEKSWKKRVVVNVDFATNINLQRLMGQAQAWHAAHQEVSPQKIAMYASMHFNDIYRYLAEFGTITMQWDCSCFDHRTKAGVQIALANYIYPAYLTKEEQFDPDKYWKKTKIYQLLQNALKMQTNLPMLFGNTIITKQGGINSGCSNTSLMDGFCMRLIQFAAFCDCVEFFKPSGITGCPSHFARCMRFVHCGDDVTGVISEHGEWILVDKGDFFVSRLVEYGLSVTHPDNKDDVGVKIGGLTDLEFVSSTWTTLYQHPSVRIPKLVMSSITSPLMWKNQDAGKDTLYEMAYSQRMQIIGHGPVIFEEYELVLDRFAKKHGIPHVRVSARDFADGLYSDIVTKKPFVDRIDKDKVINRVTYAPPAVKLVFEVPRESSMSELNCKELRKRLVEVALSSKTRAEAVLKAADDVILLAECPRKLLNLQLMSWATPGDRTKKFMSCPLASSPAVALGYGVVSPIWLASWERADRGTQGNVLRYDTFAQIFQMLQKENPHGYTEEQIWIAAQAIMAPPTTDDGLCQLSCKIGPWIMDKAGFLGPVPRQRPGGERALSNSAPAAVSIAPPSTAPIAGMPAGEPAVAVQSSSNAAALPVMMSNSSMGMNPIEQTMLGSYTDTKADAHTFIYLKELAITSNKTAGSIIETFTCDPWKGTACTAPMKLWANLHKVCVPEIEITMELGNAAALMGSVMMAFIPPCFAGSTQDLPLLSSFPHVIVDLSQGGKACMRFCPIPVDATHKWLTKSDGKLSGDLVLIIYKTTRNVWNQSADTITVPIVLESRFVPMGESAMEGTMFTQATWKFPAEPTPPITVGPTPPLVNTINVDGDKGDEWSGIGNLPTTTIPLTKNEEGYYTACIDLGSADPHAPSVGDHGFDRHEESGALTDIVQQNVVVRRLWGDLDTECDPTQKAFDEKYDSKVNSEFAQTTYKEPYTWTDAITIGIPAAQVQHMCVDTTVDKYIEYTGLDVQLPKAFVFVDDTSNDCSMTMKTPDTNSGNILVKESRVRADNKIITDKDFKVPTTYEMYLGGVYDVHRYMKNLVSSVTVLQTASFNGKCYSTSGAMSIDGGLLTVKGREGTKECPAGYYPVVFGDTGYVPAVAPGVSGFTMPYSQSHSQFMAAVTEWYADKPGGSSYSYVMTVNGEPVGEMIVNIFGPFIRFQSGEETIYATMYKATNVRYSQYRSFATYWPDVMYASQKYFINRVATTKGYCHVKLGKTELTIVPGEDLDSNTWIQRKLMRRMRDQIAWVERVRVTVDEEISRTMTKYEQLPQAQKKGVHSRLFSVVATKDDKKEETGERALMDDDPPPPLVFDEDDPPPPKGAPLFTQELVWDDELGMCVPAPPTPMSLQGGVKTTVRMINGVPTLGAFAPFDDDVPFGNGEPWQAVWDRERENREVLDRLRALADEESKAWVPKFACCHTSYVDFECPKDHPGTHRRPSKFAFYDERGLDAGHVSLNPAGRQARSDYRRKINVHDECQARDMWYGADTDEWLGLNMRVDNACAYAKAKMLERQEDVLDGPFQEWSCTGVALFFNAYYGTDAFDAYPMGTEGPAECFRYCVERSHPTNMWIHESEFEHGVDPFKYHCMWALYNWMEENGFRVTMYGEAPKRGGDHALMAMAPAFIAGGLLSGIGSGISAFAGAHLNLELQKRFLANQFNIAEMQRDAKVEMQRNQMGYNARSATGNQATPRPPTAAAVVVPNFAPWTGGHPPDMHTPAPSIPGAWAGARPRDMHTPAPTITSSRSSGGSIGSAGSLNWDSSSVSSGSSSSGNIGAASVANTSLMGRLNGHASPDVGDSEFPGGLSSLDVLEAHTGGLGSRDDLARDSPPASHKVNTNPKSYYHLYAGSVAGSQSSSGDVGSPGDLPSEDAD